MFDNKKEPYIVAFRQARNTNNEKIYTINDLKTVFYIHQMRDWCNENIGEDNYTFILNRFGEYEGIKIYDDVDVMAFKLMSL